MAMEAEPERSKTILACLGERKRPISIPHDASVKAMKLAVVAEYSDVLQRSSSCTDESIAQSLILQMKAEDWDGVFIDVSDGVVIPDKTVVRVVEECPKVQITIYP